MLPYFKRAEDNQRFADDYHGYGGPLGVSIPINPLPICEAFLRAGAGARHPLQPRLQRRAAGGRRPLPADACATRRRSSAAVGLSRRRSAAAPNLTVRTGAHGARASWSRSGRAVGVEIVDGRRAATASRAEREVHRHLRRASARRGCCCYPASARPIICARSASPVVHDLPGVGANLQDHLDLFVDRRMHRRPHLRQLRQARTARVWAGLQYLLFRQGPGRLDPVRDRRLLVRRPGRALARHPVPSRARLGHRGRRREAEECRRDAELGLPAPALARHGAARQRRSRRRAADRSRTTGPTPTTGAMSLEGLRMAREIMRQPALEPFVLARAPARARACDSDDELADYACRTCKTDHHPVGTCQMGAGRHGRRRRRTCKVRGLEGLRVCDSSVMPRVPSSNTNAPTIMVGEKAADLVLGRVPLSAAVNLQPSGDRLMLRSFRSTTHHRGCAGRHGAIWPALPGFATWSPQRRRANPRSAEDDALRGLGWNVVEFGSGAFATEGWWSSPYAWATYPISRRRRAALWREGSSSVRRPAHAAPLSSGQDRGLVNRGGGTWSSS